VIAGMARCRKRVCGGKECARSAGRRAQGRYAAHSACATALAGTGSLNRPLRGRAASANVILGNSYMLC